MSTDTRRMTAQQWADLYGCEFSATSGRMWMTLLAVLLIGGMLGAFAVPHDALTVYLPADARADASGDGLAGGPEQSAHARSLATAVREGMAETKVEIVTDLSPAFVYTVRDPDSEKCTNLLSVLLGDKVVTTALTAAHTCAG